MKRSLPFLLAVVALCGSTFAQEKPQDPPRIVNIYNFIRNSDYRVPNSEDVLFETTRQQLQLVNEHHLPATWALQYDALMNPKYQKLLKQNAGPEQEIAAWWEIPKPLAEKAGLKWRGDHDWDSTANIGFSPGYTPAERVKLVDVYMNDFKQIFGRYPRTVGSWFIDEVTLAYMVDHYGIVASCNCKDQVGTDGYTLWGGYWNQAYYPSKLNAYMPAQTRAGQIDVPLFRMLGSDPIYQMPNARGIFSLEPVYPRAGGSPKWVGWFMNQMTRQPCLAFAYTQAGQENSFGWDAMKKGFTQQIQTFDAMKKSGEIRVETLEESGKWFHANYPLTPATSVVCLDDWRHENRKTVWYDSRFYRINFLWEDDGFFIRDLHRFDESLTSATHDSALKTRSLAYGTLPVVEGVLWSEKGKHAGGFPVLIGADGTTSPMTPVDAPVVSEPSATDLKIVQKLKGDLTLWIVCGESRLFLTALDRDRKPVKWAIDLIGGEKQKSAVREVTNNCVTYQAEQKTYGLKLDSGSIELKKRRHHSAHRQ